MNKKLTSVLLSAVLLGQSPMHPYVSADDCEPVPTQVPTQSTATQNYNISFSKIALGIVGVTGLGLLGAYLIHHFKGQSSEENTACDPRRRLALNNAVGQLYNSEHRNVVLSFPRNRAIFIMQNIPLDSPTRSALRITIALNKAFHDAPFDSAAIDLEKNERLLGVLHKNTIKGCNDFTGVLRNAIAVSSDFVTNFRQENNDPRTLEIQSGAEQWLTTNPISSEEAESDPQQGPGIATPLRSIKWHSNLCWLYASILLFFHEKHYREFICNFRNHEEVIEGIMTARDTSEADKAVLTAMCKLSDMFNDLNQHPEGGILCVDYSHTMREPDLIDALCRAFQYDPINGSNYVRDIQYGMFNDCISRPLYLLIQRSAEILELNNSILPALDVYERNFVGLPELKIVSSHDFSHPHVKGHYWLEISRNGQEQKLAIGELLDSEHSIEVEQATNSKP